MKTREQIINGMCLIWDHSYGAPTWEEGEPGASLETAFGRMTKNAKEGLFRSMAQVFDNEIVAVLKERAEAAKSCLADMRRRVAELSALLEIQVKHGIREDEVKAIWKKLDMAACGMYPSEMIESLDVPPPQCVLDALAAACDDE